jgi:hypothetical protein
MFCASSQIWPPHGSPACTVQVPPAQVSAPLQNTLSLHGEVFGVYEHAPATHPSFVHGLLSLQLIVGPGMHWPPAQVSPTVQASPSVQASVFGVNVQPPAGEQVSVVHGLLSLQTVAGPGTHWPAEHMSPVVHASPSLQVLVFGVFRQPLAAPQVSVVHGLSSSQSTAAPLMHMLFMHSSSSVHRFPSLQGSKFGV